MSECYFDPSKIELREVSSSTAKDIIVKYHYSHKWTLCKKSYGIFQKMDNESPFFDEKEERLIGVVVYGGPVGRSAAKSISDIVEQRDVIELVRLFIHDGTGKNIESYCIAKSLKMLKRDLPNIKVVISYADNEAGHTGKIYQSGNWLYQGNSSLALMPNYSVSLTGPPNYSWMHSRTVSERYGSHNIEHLKKRIGKTFYRKIEASKHRYLYFLCGKIEKKRILQSLKHPLHPYPKNASYDADIEVVKVDELKENSFF